jgi:hypothetical protein
VRPRHHVLVPFGVPAPAGTAVHVWDGGPLPGPDLLAAVSLHVLPYTFDPSCFAALPLLPNLRVLQTLTAGFEHVLPHLPPGVTLCNARGVHDASTAELAVTLVLAALRGIPAFVRAQDRQEWAHAAYPALADRRVLVVGAGGVGRAVAARLAGFECEVTLVARTARDGVRARADLPNLLGSAQVVVLAVPLDAATAHLADRAFLAALPDGALLVNVTCSSPAFAPRARRARHRRPRSDAAARGMLRAVGMTDDDFTKPQIGIASLERDHAVQPVAGPARHRRSRRACTPPAATRWSSARSRCPTASPWATRGCTSRWSPARSSPTASRPSWRPSASTGRSAGRLRQVPAGDADGRRPPRRRRGVPLRRLDPARHRPDVGRHRARGHHHRRLRGRRRVRPRPDVREDVDAIERAICPGEGACGGMYTANTMASAAEALGMSLPGSAAPPAVDRRRDGFARRSGEAVVELLRQGITARQILTKPAFENAIAVVMALGGSTNAVLHLLAIAHEATSS